MATQKITMGKKRATDANSEAAAAIAQAQNNPYIWGMNDALQQQATLGYGTVTKDSIHPIYGNTRLVTGDAIDGKTGNFKPMMGADLEPLIQDLHNHTGYLEAGTSSTIQPHTDPGILAGNLQARVAGSMNGNQYPGLNNRSQTMRG